MTSSLSGAVVIVIVYGEVGERDTVGDGRSIVLRAKLADSGARLLHLRARQREHHADVAGIFEALARQTEDRLLCDHVFGELSV